MYIIFMQLRDANQGESVIIRIKIFNSSDLKNQTFILQPYDKSQGAD